MSTGETAAPHVTRLESGYWHVRWSREVWAQWPVGRPAGYGDFFNAIWAHTPERERAANTATGEAGR